MGKPTEKKKKKKGLVCIDGVWHYRRRIPDDIRRILREQDSDGDADSEKSEKREEKKRLGRDPIRAKAVWEEHHLRVEKRWAQLRKGSFGEPTVVQREALAGEVYHLWLKRYPPDRPGAGNDAFHDLADLKGILDEIPNDDWQMIDLMQRLCVDDVLAARGLIIHPSRCWMLVIAAHRAAQHACRFALRRYEGDMRPDPEAERYPIWPDPETTTLTGLHRKWIINRRPNPETQRSFRSVIDKLVAFTGFDDVTRLTTADVRRWCASLKAQCNGELIPDIELHAGPPAEVPAAPPSRDISDRRIREHYLAAVKAVLNSAVTMGHLECNVAAPVKVDIKDEQEKQPKDLRDCEIDIILRATTGPFEDDIGEHVRAARRWVPWLLAYTGARVSEMCRLESRHIIREDGVDAIHIETSKTGLSRKIPIHQDLLDQGFLIFVAERRGQPLFFDKAKLLDGKSLTIHRTRAEGLAAWVCSLKGMENLTVKPNHGWRHRYRTECRRLYMDREVRNYLMGHAVETVGEGYGHVPVDVSAVWMEMFPRYDVSGPELVVHRRYDLSAVRDAARRMAEVEGLASSRAAAGRSAASVQTANGPAREPQGFVELWERQVPQRAAPRP